MNTVTEHPHGEPGHHHRHLPDADVRLRRPAARHVHEPRASGTMLHRRTSRSACRMSSCRCCRSCSQMDQAAAGGRDGPGLHAGAGVLQSRSCRRSCPASSPGMIMAFTLSLDDFVISYFTSGNGFADAADPHLQHDEKDRHARRCTPWRPSSSSSSSRCCCMTNLVDDDDTPAHPRRPPCQAARASPPAPSDKRQRPPLRDAPP